MKTLLLATAIGAMMLAGLAQAQPVKPAQPGCTVESNANFSGYPIQTPGLVTADCDLFGPKIELLKLTNAGADVAVGGVSSALGFTIMDTYTPSKFPKNNDFALWGYANGVYKQVNGLPTFGTAPGLVRFKIRYWFN